MFFDFKFSNHFIQSYLTLHFYLLLSHNFFLITYFKFFKF